MMKYYKLQYDFKKGATRDYAFCKNSNIEDFDVYSVHKGRFISCWNNNITLEYDPKESSTLTDYLANVYRWVLVSQSCKELIERLVPNQAQYLPVHIVNMESGNADAVYYVINVLDVVDGLDLPKLLYTIFKTDEKDVLSVIKYALKKEIVTGHHLLKLQNDLIPIFVSECLKDAIIRNRMTGFDFLDVKVI